MWYVLKRPLVRPETSYKKVACCILLFLVANCGVSVLLYCLLRWLGISSVLPDFIDKFYKEHQVALTVWIILFQFSAGGILALKSALIGAIRLYQRYAPERIRRKCLFKPTCSEYAILAIKKYGVIRGLYKTYVRLFKKCRGRIYSIDEP